MSGPSISDAKIRFIFEAIGEKKIDRALIGSALGVEKFQKQLISMRKEFGVSNVQAKVFTQKLGDMSLAVKDSAKAAEMAKKSWGSFFSRFQPGFLSMMFGGMQLQRMMGGLIRGMISNFKELASETDPTRIALTRLEGSLKFLKFQIVSAAGPLLQKFVDWLSTLATDLAKSDPEKLKKIAVAIGSVWTLGLALFTIGQLGTFVTGMGNLVKEMSSANAATAATNLDNTAAAMSKMREIGSVAIGFYFLYDSLKDFNEGKVLDGISSALGAGAAGAMYVGKLGAYNKILVAKLGLDIATDVIGGNPKGMFNSLGDFFMMSGLGRLMMGGPHGWAFLTIGILFKSGLAEDFYDEVRNAISFLTGGTPEEGTIAFKAMTDQPIADEEALRKMYENSKNTEEQLEKTADAALNLGSGETWSDAIQNANLTASELERLNTAEDLFIANTTAVSEDVDERIDFYNDLTESINHAREALEKLNEAEGGAGGSGNSSSQVNMSMPGGG